LTLYGCFGFAVLCTMDQCRFALLEKKKGN
jgi:hypothetical protein